MATIRWTGGGAPNPTWWDQANNWIGAAVPVHGDDVQFLGADLSGANRCAVGPTAIVLLNSIYADSAYDNGVNATVCYANCGMTGRPLATVTIEGDSYMAGGFATTATLSKAAGSSRITGGTVTTATLSGGATCQITGGTIGTATLNGTSRVAGGTTTTGHFDGDGTRLASGTVTTVNINGANVIVGNATVTTLNIYGENCQIQQWNTIGTVYVYADATDISEIAIGQGDITNGPYMCGQFQILYDYETGEVLADLTEIAAYAGGIW